MFGCQTYDLKPDMITVAKGLSSDYMISEPIWQACLSQRGKIGVFGHGFTYSGHPVCAAVSLEALAIYDEMDVVAQVRRIALTLQDGLHHCADHPGGRGAERGHFAGCGHAP
jgi:4-aminobutyrate--pyruvate transaminase